MRGEEEEEDEGGIPRSPYQHPARRRRWVRKEEEEEEEEEEKKRTRNRLDGFKSSPVRPSVRSSSPSPCYIHRGCSRSALPK